MAIKIIFLNPEVTNEQVYALIQKWVDANPGFEIIGTNIVKVGFDYNLVIDYQ